MTTTSIVIIITSYINQNSKRSICVSKRYIDLQNSKHYENIQAQGRDGWIALLCNVGHFYSCNFYYNFGYFGSTFNQIEFA